MIIFRNIVHKIVFGIANYKFDDKLTKLKMADPKWRMQST